MSEIWLIGAIFTIGVICHDLEQDKGKYPIWFQIFMMIFPFIARPFLLGFAIADTVRSFQKPKA